MNFTGKKLLEKIPSRFGNGSHVLVSREFAGKTAKIIFGKCTINSGKIKIDFFKSEIIEREIKYFGTGAHVIVPKEYSGKKIKIIVGGEDE